MSRNALNNENGKLTEILPEVLTRGQEWQKWRLTKFCQSSDFLQMSGVQFDKNEEFGKYNLAYLEEGPGGVQTPTFFNPMLLPYRQVWKCPSSLFHSKADLRIGSSVM